jgi:hypothetical protein
MSPPFPSLNSKLSTLNPLKKTTCMLGVPAAGVEVATGELAGGEPKTNICHRTDFVRVLLPGA